MAAAIWSAPAQVLLDYPAEAFIRFCENHGLLQVSNRPAWRTVHGGSRTYVARLAERLGPGVRLGCAVAKVVRHAGGVDVLDAAGGSERFDAVVIATHADQALAMLAEPDPQETDLLGAFRYSRNKAVLHADPSLMPRRRSVWASWNYIGRRADARDPSRAQAELCVSYWMNQAAAAGHRSPPVRHAQPVAHAGREPHLSRADLRTSDLRRCRSRRAAAALVASGASSHLVLRRSFRCRLPRGRSAVRTCRRRAAGWCPPPVERCEGVRPHRHVDAGERRSRSVGSLR